MMNKKVIIESPGRINMIGEHIDYNGGLVMPAATNKKLIIEIEISHGNSSVVRSKLFDESFEINIDSIKKSDVGWHNYILGVLENLITKRQVRLVNFSCVIGGDLPVGAGVSSSSSLICGVLKGISSINSLDISNEEIIQIAREVEHEFIGVKGGIMDQFTIINGKENKLILLDCSDLSYKYVDANFDKYQILLLNTNVKHNLSETSYNDRVLECFEALEIINRKKNKYKYLVDVPSDVLRNLKSEFQKNIFKRALYVIEEQKRVRDAYKNLLDNDMISLGKLMYESHFGLKNLYEVSCKELDFLVEYSTMKSYVVGSRMMGGGFGGCVINLIDKDETEGYIKNISRRYQEKFSISLGCHIIDVSEGLKLSI